MGRLPLLTVLAALALAAPAHALTAPGLVAYPVAVTAGAEPHVDAGGASTGVTLADGSTIVAGGDQRGVGAFAMKLTASGAQDRSFGAGGTARIAQQALSVPEILQRPDGRIVIVVSAPAPSNRQLPELMLVGLSAGGATDTAFGKNGIVDTGVQGGGRHPVALAPDGTIVVTGNTGNVGRVADGEPNAPQQFTWVVARFSASGAPVASFGSAGVVSLAGPATVAGNDAAVLGDGRIVLTGTVGRTVEVRRLLATGAPDPSLNGGVLEMPSAIGSSGVFAGDGTLTLAGDGILMRVTPGAGFDPAFGPNGLSVAGVSRTSLLVADSNGSVLAYQTVFPPRAFSKPALTAVRVSATGAAASLAALIPLAGGTAGFCCAQHRIMPQPSLAQGGLLVTRLLSQPGGGYLAIGGVSVVQYSGEGEGRSAGFAAAALLDADLRVSPRYGGQRVTPTAAVRVLSQSLRTSRRNHTVLLKITSSAPGLALVNVRDGARRVLFSGVVPIYATGENRVRLPITATGRTQLARGRRTRISVSMALRDIMNAQTRATARRTLR